MRVGLSWTPKPDADAKSAWATIISEATTADAVGLDSVCVHESRTAPNGCPSPSVMLTFLSRRTRTVQLIGTRLLEAVNPARLAEEVGVLDTFARGRAGLGFASASSQGAPSGRLHETIDFVTAAWATDELRYRGGFIRFPTHTPDDAPAGVSTPEPGDSYVPQWERGPVMPDFLAITPKPLAARPPVFVEIADRDTLEWAARQGISPLVKAHTPTEEAVASLQRYREIAAAAGRRRGEVEVALERHIAMGGDGDDTTVGGSSTELIDLLRDLGATAGVSHLIWNRRGPSDGDLFQFAREVQLMLQA